MKRIIGVIAGLVLMMNINSQELEPRTSFYGVQMYQSSTGSGYGASYNINANFTKNQRVFEVGIMLNSASQKFMGLEFLYKHFLGYKSTRFYSHKVKTYLHYNFLYRSPQDIIINQSALKSGSVDPSYEGSKMTTLEHAIGFGTQINVFSNLFFDCNTGVGVYLGSKYMGSTPNTWGIHKNNFGIVPSLKFGFGYKF
jgi:hypothetical protein